MIARSDTDHDTRTDDVIVAVDGSVASRAALSWAVRDAQSTGRRVCAVRVFDPAFLYAPPVPVYEAIADARAAERAALRETVTETVGEPAGVRLETELLEGDPATELVRRVEGAGMLVMGSHGRTRAGTVLLGSVGAACVRGAGCPVLIIPPRAAGRVLAETAADPATTEPTTDPTTVDRGSSDVSA